MRFHNLTTSAITVSGAKGALTFEAAPAPGQDGPLLDLCCDLEARAVLSDVAQQVAKLIEDGKIRHAAL